MQTSCLEKKFFFKKFKVIHLGSILNVMLML